MSMLLKSCQEERDNLRAQVQNANKKIFEYRDKWIQAGLTVAELRAEVERLKSDNKTLDFNLVETSKQLAAHKADAERKFYQGIEWFACWLLDNVEGEIITEEQLRPWAAKALSAHDALKGTK